MPAAVDAGLVTFGMTLAGRGIFPLILSLEFGTDDAEDHWGNQEEKKGAGLLTSPLFIILVGAEGLEPST